MAVAGSPPQQPPPSVDAGADRTVAEGQSVTLSGTASDQDNDRLAYTWTHDSAFNMNLAGANTTSVSFTAPQVDSNTTVTFTFTADDGAATSYDTVALTIIDAPPNNPPTADAGVDQTVREGQTVTLSGTADDPDGDHLTYLWTHDHPALEITLANRTAPSTTFTAPQVDSNATIILTLAATDRHNATASDTMAVTVLDVRAGTGPIICQQHRGARSAGAPRLRRHRQDHPEQLPARNHPGDLGGPRRGAGQLPRILGQGGRAVPDLDGQLRQRLPHRALPIPSRTWRRAGHTR